MLGCWIARLVAALDAGLEAQLDDESTFVWRTSGPSQLHQRRQWSTRHRPDADLGLPGQRVGASLNNRSCKDCKVKKLVAAPRQLLTTSPSANVVQLSGHDVLHQKNLGLLSLGCNLVHVSYALVWVCRGFRGFCGF